MGLNGISCRASGSSGFLSAGAETSGRTCHHSGPGSEPAVLALETSSVTEPEANEALIKTSDTGPRNGFRLHPHGGTYRGAFHRWILSRCFHITPQLAVSCLLVVLVTVSVLSGCTSEEPLLQDDACVLALLLGVLHAIFEAAACPNPTVRRFFRIVPSLLLCYFIPGLLGSAHVISPKRSQLPAIASGFLLPSCLVLLTIGTNAAAVARLGRTAVAMFAIGALGVMLGGPVAVAAASLLSKEAVAGDTWKGLACIAGSWIGGSANQLAMKEVFEVPDGVFAQAVAVDVFVSNLWMAALLLAAENSAAIDAWLRADASGIAELGQRMEDSALEAARVAGFRDYLGLAAVAFGVTGASTWLGSHLAGFVRTSAKFLGRVSLDSPFFWIILLAGAFGLALSFTPARRLEGAGASKIGSLFLYVMIATIGMRMDFSSLREAPGMIAVGVIWILVHATVMVCGAILLKSPVFFLAVGSQANIGGAASAPVVAAAFHPNLATVGVLLAVLGYSTGTALAWITGLLLHWILASLK